MRLNAWFLSTVIVATVLGCLHGGTLWVRLSCALPACALYIITWALSLAFKEECDELRRRLAEKE